MYGCPNIGGLGRLQCLDSCSLSSLLVNIDVSGCNLFNNSFSEDWSNLFSLKFFDISSNHITSLPGCVKSLPSLEEIYARRCSHLQSVLDVPNTVTYLNTTMNFSLEKVQPTPNTTFLSFYGCEKLCEVEDCFKLESIKKNDRRILRYLGIELVSEKGMGFILDDKLYTEEVSIKCSSFRGEDTRKTFTDHLYAALKQAGIRTFMDDDAMDRGKLLGPELEKAILESAVSIIVFSRDYASSKWCLDEVLTIIEEQERISSKHEVVPVFYNVEPSDVRNQTGSFEKAFGEYDNMIEAETDHQKKIEWREKGKAWRVSLRKAGSLTGMVLANGYAFFLDHHL
ncbi:hypothetical protein L1987_48966 [Smallanthus sonchifolius]|uniref:Uncharacterized protein n=1 Tax=Smallanthus sonchifolius TaxID=185202 RepID=A0ACB9FTX4_9ASTR|nr:hypothetical protein L1987_48966 [Smallanthus sonchifolius]